MVSELADRVLIAGTSAARQRRALRRRGRLTDVVDQLIDETAGRRPETRRSGVRRPHPALRLPRPPRRRRRRESALPSYDEAVDTTAASQASYEKILRSVADLGVTVLRAREGDVEQDQRAENVTFRVSGQSRAQVFPLDLMPRLIAADEWAHLTAGLGQRARALNAFLRDIYSEQAIVADGVIGVHALDRAPGFRSAGRLSDAVRAHICGTDLVCDRPGNWMVLEDNLRVPSGTAYAIANRRLLTKHLPEVERPRDIGDVDRVPSMLLDTLRASAPAQVRGEPSVALLSGGWDDSAWFEHTFLAAEMGIALVQSSDLSIHDGKLLRHLGSDVQPVDVIYARMDEDMLLSSTGYDGAPLRYGLLDAVATGR